MAEKDKTSASAGFLGRSIRSLCALTGARVTVHDYGGDLRPLLPPGMHLHDNPYCHWVKRIALEGERRCQECDSHRVQDRLRQGPGGFAKRCHGGVLEAVVPVTAFGTLQGALFLGPFLPQGHPPTGCLVQKPSRLPQEDAPLPPPPGLSGARLQQWLPVVELLASALGLALEQSKASLPKPGQKGYAVQLYVDRHFYEPLTLNSVARALGLSPSRCSQIVRQELGTRFPDLVNTRRVAYARKLLRHTRFPVKDIAAQVGYPSTAYFCRVFREREGESPLAYRARVGGPAAA